MTVKEGILVNKSNRFIPLFPSTVVSYTLNIPPNPLTTEET